MNSELKRRSEQVVRYTLRYCTWIHILALCKTTWQSQ